MNNLIDAFNLVLKPSLHFVFSMGCNESVTMSDSQEKMEGIKMPNIYKRSAILSELPDNVSKNDFQTARMKKPINGTIRELNQYAIDLSKKPNLPKTFKKACFLCCNTYTKPAYKLGVGPLNDTLTVAVNHKKMGYVCYYLHNPTAADFMKYLKLFMSHTTSNLTVFFTGHGAGVKDQNGDESDGYDEAMVFDKGHIIDDDLVPVLATANGKVKIVLLTDCCHSGSIWDIQSAKKHGIKLPKNIISLSAAKDEQTAKQTTMKQKDQGIFTYYFWNLFNQMKNPTVKAMEPKVNASIQRFKQYFTIASTSNNMLTDPLFQ